MRTTLAALAALVVVLAPAVGPDAARSAVFEVNTTADGPGDCVTPGGTCTLRAAIVDAKTATPGEPDTIVLGPGVHENTGNDFILAIGERVTIVGAGARSTTVRETSGGDGRVFLVEQDAALTLSDLTVGGSRDASGVLLFGGGNALLATRVSFVGNSALARGGAIDGTGGAVELFDSTVSGNAAAGAGGMAGRGGGIFSGGAGASLELTNVTVSGNTAGSGSGVHVAAGQARLTAVTLAGNLPAGGAGATGGELATEAAAPAVQIAGSILGGCAGQPPASLGHNVEPGASCGLTGPGDRPGTDPLLGPLADAGGPTDTRAPSPGSPAIDAAGACAPLATDQRGVARPQGPACDSGAFEVVVAPAAPPNGKPPQPPRIVRLSVAPRAFGASPRAGGRGRQRGGRRGRGRARRAPGTRVRFRLTAPATVVLTVERAVRGRRAGGRCVPVRRATRRGRACRRWTRRPGAIRRSGSEGANGFRFRGRIGGRLLRPGRYRLVARPLGGRRVRTHFRVLR